jgi:hypothetical protein
VHTHIESVAMTSIASKLFAITTANSLITHATIYDRPCIDTASQCTVCVMMHTLDPMTQRENAEIVSTYAISTITMIVNPSRNDLVLDGDVSSLHIEWVIAHTRNHTNANIWRAELNVAFRGTREFRQRFSGNCLELALRCEPTAHRWARNLNLAQVISQNLLNCPFVGQFRDGSVDLAAEAVFHTVVETAGMDKMVQRMIDNVFRRT